jgi:hypothetical protein
MTSLAWTFVVIFGLSACVGWPMQIKGTYWAISASVLAEVMFAEVAAVLIVGIWNFSINQHRRLEGT